MEITVSLIVIGVVAGVIFLILNRRDDDSNETPPVTPPVTPPIPEPEEVFSATSFVDTREPVTSMEFLPNGDVKSTYTLGNIIKTAILGNVLDGLSPDPDFEVRNISVVPFLGPRTGSLNDSPKWELNIPTGSVGFRGSSLIITLTDSTGLKKTFKVVLTQEVPDLRL